MTASSGEGILLREVNHRMLNTLTIISVNLRRDLEYGEGSPHDVLERYERLINAQADVYRCLSLQSSGTVLAADAYFARLCRSLSEAVLEPLGIACVVMVEPGDISRTQCERLGMVVAELVVNAAKYAFDAPAPGRLEIALRRRDDGWRCIVADNGMGKVHAAKGAGGLIVQCLIASINGTLRTRSGSAGTTVAIYIPDPTTASQSADRSS
jgi:two-component sensor histidine kinase